ncbi:MAG: M48 family metalloprotease, partial [Acidimicrobiia bacterium]
RAKPLGPTEMPDVHSIVSSLAQREGMPMPDLYVIDSAQPNAFATGRSPKHAAVAVTTGIVDMLDQRELEGVLAHELAHVRNRDILIATIAATLAAALSLLARMAFWGNMGGRRNNDNPIGLVLGLIGMIVVPIAAGLLQMAISRSREFEADHDGAESTGSPLALASALQKISYGAARVPMNVNPAISQLFIEDPTQGSSPRRRRSMMKMFSTHPPVDERIDRLEKMASGIY